MEHNYKELLREYRTYLAEHEKSHATIQKYVREVVWFLSFLQGEELTKAKVLEYREQLQQKHHARTVNAKLSAIHSYLDYLGPVSYTHLDVYKRQDLIVKRVGADHLLC